VARAVPKKILVATDFSETSDEAVRHAQELATALRASLYLLHIVSSDLGPGAPELWGVDSDDLQERLETKAKTELDQLGATLAQDGVVPHAATRFGAAADSINDYAREQDIDLIVIGTHGRSGVEHLLLGSVAENVVRGAPCPVLVVRPAPPKP
jgi:universal stress protein A